MQKNLFMVIYILVFVFALGCGVVKPRIANRNATHCEETFVTGSRIPQTVCSGSRQREERTARDQMELERIQRRTRAPSGN